ncbi:hypothetical protein ABFV05_010756 [Capra hircus]
MLCFLQKWDAPRHGVQEQKAENRQVVELQLWGQAWQALRREQKELVALPRELGAAICELNEYYVCHTTLKFNVHAVVTSLPSPSDSESSLCAFHVNDWECIDAFHCQPEKQLN